MDDTKKPCSQEAWKPVLVEGHASTWRHNGRTRVTFSKTGRTIYYQGKRLQRGRPTSCGNYYDMDTGDEYWVSGPKKNGEDRYQWGKASRVEIDEDARDEYWTTIRNQPERKNEGYT